MSDNSGGFLQYVVDANTAKYGTDGVVFNDTPIFMTLDGDTLTWVDDSGTNPHKPCKTAVSMRQR